MRVLLTLAVVLLSYASAFAACPDNVDTSKVTGIDTTEYVEVICGASKMRIILDSATVRDTVFLPSGKIPTNLTNEELSRRSAKLVDVSFRARGIMTFSMTKLRDKIERYMAETYVALFKQDVPLRRVRISALYPMDNDGAEGVVYGTTIWNKEGKYGPGSMPQGWETWRLHQSLR